MTSAAASSRAGTAVWPLARLAIRIFYRVQRIGATLPDGPVLLVANHPNSLLDPALVQATAGRPIRFLAKSTLFRGHLLSPLIRRSGAIPVHRRMDQGAGMSRNEEMFAAVEAVLAQAAVVCLFPEGISHSTGRLEQLRSGAARFGLRERDVDQRISTRTAVRFTVREGLLAALLWPLALLSVLLFAVP